MVDAALIQKCADPGLKPAIVEKFVATAGATDPLAITVRAGGRVVLVPPPKSSDEALALVRRYVGQAVVRVGITQYPAGVGVTDASQLTGDLVDACKNIRMGTALFAKVYRIVVKWYGVENDNAFEDAIIAWRTGTFEDIAVFSAPHGVQRINLAASKRSRRIQDAPSEPNDFRVLPQNTTCSSVCVIDAPPGHTPSLKIPGARPP